MKRAFQRIWGGRDDCTYFLQHFCSFLQLIHIFSNTPPPFFFNFSYPTWFGVCSLLSIHTCPFWLFKRSYQPAHSSPPAPPLPQPPAGQASHPLAPGQPDPVCVCVCKYFSKTPCFSLQSLLIFSKPLDFSTNPIFLHAPMLLEHAGSPSLRWTWIVVVHVVVHFEVFHANTKHHNIYHVQHTLQAMTAQVHRWCNIEVTAETLLLAPICLKDRGTDSHLEGK